MTTFQTNETNAHPDALTQLCLTILPIWERHISNARAHAETAVSEMVGAFSATVSAIPGQGAQDKALQVNIERVYAGLQYQDRINQMLCVLQDDIQRLVEVLHSSAVTPDTLSATAWLQRLESNYTMPEQHGVGSGNGSTGAGEQNVKEAGNVSFF